jgi:serpin B
VLPEKSKESVMNRIILAAPLLLFSLLPVSVSWSFAEGTRMEAKKLAQSENAFATDLYAQLRQEPGNFFFSPHSIAAALSMTFVGARGETSAEMAKALHLENLHAENRDATLPLRRLVLERYAEQRKLLNEPLQDGLELHIANALWAKATYPLNSEFVRAIKESFGGSLEPVDFSNEPAARKKINGWVSDQTRDKIRDLIGPGVLTPATRLVLTNAIYFKAAWEEQFRKGATTKEKFHVSVSKDVDAEMMKQTHFFSLAELEGFKLLGIPYKHNEASMLVLLPDKVDGLADLERSLTAEKLTSWVEKSKSVRVALSLPKFKNISAFDLNDPLITLGMKKAFAADQADFTGIANVPGEPLYIGLVIHKAFVDVNEEGTEAAAATAAAMLAAAAMRPAEPVPFVADHPFVYIIRSNRTGDILFMGRLTDPTEPGK